MSTATAAVVAPVAVPDLLTVCLLTAASQEGRDEELAGLADAYAYEEAAVVQDEAGAYPHVDVAEVKASLVGELGGMHNT